MNYEPVYNPDIQTFHSSGLKPWICGLLKPARLKNVLDVGCGFGL